MVFKALIIPVGTAQTAAPERRSEVIPPTEAANTAYGAGRRHDARYIMVSPR